MRPSPDHAVNDVPASESDGGHVRLRLDMSYDGTEFAGWAPQAGQRTVAGVIEETLSTVFREPVRLVTAGRTDTGVHATGQVAHVDVPSRHNNARRQRYAGIPDRALNDGRPRRGL